MNVDHLTDDREVRKAWACPDAELKTMLSILPRIPLSSRDAYKECIRLHDQYIESGLVNIPWEYQEELQKLDPYLRLRYDMQCQCYVVERIDTGLRAWIRLYRWANADGSAKPLSLLAVREMVAKLRDGDMQRIGPEEHLKRKREKAEATKQANWQRGVDELNSVVDGMSRRQVEEFIAAERAIASGEKIHVRGQDAATLNMWHDMGRTGQVPPSIPGPEQAINPHHNPTQVQQGVRA